MASLKLSRGAKRLLELVPPDGVFIGNTALKRRARLGKSYWKSRNELVYEGLLILGKGRGGSVARSSPSGGALRASTEKGFVRRESELYDPLGSWLQEEWGKEVEAGDFFEVLITGSARNKRRASGQWSRPDVTVVQVNSYDYLPQPVLEVTTFEVKKFPEAENIRSVYETAAHSRWAHFSYLVAEVPRPDYEFPARFLSELERFHLGLIFMWKENQEWQFDEQAWETNRLNPEPEELNGLLKAFFQESKREKEFKLALGKN